MTCLTNRINDTACISCKRADQVYIGHGEVRFCAYCTLSWDKSEDGTFLSQQKSEPGKGTKGTAIAYEGVEGGELPEDIAGRISVLAGSIHRVMDFERRIQAMMEIPISLFDEEAETLKLKHGKAGAWQSIVSGFSRVMALVHLSMRMLPVDIEALQKELSEARIKEFEETLSDFIDLSGCGGKAKLIATNELDAIETQSRADAQSIADTYNLDLANTLTSIRSDTPTANRNIFAKRLRGWDAKRSVYKNTQIALHTTMTARSEALQSFANHNNLKPESELRPKIAAEPICAGWINRGRVPWSVTEANPSPYHIGCVHYWWPVKFSQADCSKLWTGGQK